MEQHIQQEQGIGKGVGGVPLSGRRIHDQGLRNGLVRYGAAKERKYYGQPSYTIYGAA